MLLNQMSSPDEFARKGNVQVVKSFIISQAAIYISLCELQIRHQLRCREARSEASSQRRQTSRMRQIQ